MSKKRSKRLKRELESAIDSRNASAIEIVHLRRRISKLEAELKEANITIEHIRDTLFKLITGRIADWLNSQGETFTCGKIPTDRIRYAKINPATVRPEFAIQPEDWRQFGDDIPDWGEGEPPPGLTRHMLGELYPR